MKKSFAIIFIFTILSAVLFNCSVISKDISINTKLTKLSLVTNSKSLNGYFLLTLNENYFSGGQFSEMLSIDNNGKIVFDRVYQNKKQNIFPVDFKEVSPGEYSYFFTQPLLWHTPATLHFLNEEFHDLFLPISSVTDRELDSHDVFKTEDGNYFLLFARKGIKDAAVNPEIQEWNQSGEVIFSWKTFDHINKSETSDMETDSIHINSMVRGEKNEIFICLSYLGEIFKIEYPSGKLLERISNKRWIFANDPHNGFNGQHSINYLGNNKILLFDNINGDNRMEARAVEYELDYKNKVAKLTWEFKAHFPDKIHRLAGSVQRLSNGNTLINWGSPYAHNTNGSKFIIFTEVSPDKKIVRELYSSKDISSYRVYFKEI